MSAQGLDRSRYLNDSENWVTLPFSISRGVILENLCSVYEDERKATIWSWNRVVGKGSGSRGE